MLYKIKRRFDSLYPTSQVYDGTKPIKLLEFLATIREVFNTLWASEALAVLALAYYLNRTSKDALHSPHHARRENHNLNLGRHVAGTCGLVHQEISHGRYLTSRI